MKRDKHGYYAYSDTVALGRLRSRMEETGLPEIVTKSHLRSYSRSATTDESQGSSSSHLEAASETRRHRLQQQTERKRRRHMNVEEIFSGLQQLDFSMQTLQQNVSNQNKAGRSTARLKQT